jgi:hypothetical protein
MHSIAEGPDPYLLTRLDLRVDEIDARGDGTNDLLLKVGIISTQSADWFCIFLTGDQDWFDDDYDDLLEAASASLVSLGRRRSGRSSFGIFVSNQWRQLSIQNPSPRYFASECK